MDNLLNIKEFNTLYVINFSKNDLSNDKAYIVLNEIEVKLKKDNSKHKINLNCSYNKESKGFCFDLNLFSYLTEDEKEYYFEPDYIFKQTDQEFLEINNIFNFLMVNFIKEYKLNYSFRIFKHNLSCFNNSSSEFYFDNDFISEKLYNLKLRKTVFGFC